MINNRPASSSTTLLFLPSHGLDYYSFGNCKRKTTNAAYIHLPANMDSDHTSIFSTQHGLSKQAQDWIFKLTQENLQNKPKAYIKKWITNRTLYICNKFKTAETQQCINSWHLPIPYPRIGNFFQKQCRSFYLKQNFYFTLLSHVCLSSYHRLTCLYLVGLCGLTLMCG